MIEISMQYTLKQIIHKFKILGAIWSRMQLALLTILRVFFFKTFGPTGVFAIYTVKKEILKQSQLKNQKNS